MYTYIHAYMHTCIHAYMHTHLHTYTHTHILTYTHTHIHIHTYVFVPEHVPQTSELHFTLNELDYIHTCGTLTFIFHQGFLQHTSTCELRMFGLHVSSIKISKQRFTSSLACLFFPKNQINNFLCLLAPFSHR